VERFSKEIYFIFLINKEIVVLVKLLIAPLPWTEGASEISLAKGGVIFCSVSEGMWNDFLMACFRLPGICGRISG
jgi:hypothetical protein